jgi:hypothetical protein
MLEHGRAVTRQMLNEPNGSPLDLADQSGEPPLALDQRQVTQVVAGNIAGAFVVAPWLAPPDPTATGPSRPASTTRS